MAYRTKAEQRGYLRYLKGAYAGKTFDINKKFRKDLGTSRHKHSKKECRRLVDKKIKLLLRENKPRNQAVAIALSMARNRGCSRYLKKKRR